MILGKSEEVAALLGDEKGDSPNEGETYEEFYQRLLTRLSTSIG
jgi:hypothetical protein